MIGPISLLVSSSRPVPRPLGRPFVVVVVDDEPDVLEFIVAVLRNGWARARVYPAADTPVAMQLLRTLRVSVVVADHRMPNTTGLEFLAHVRATYPETGRVLLTAFPDTALVIDAINDARIDAFLTKPIESKTLLSTLDRIARDYNGRMLRQAALRRAVASGR